MIKVATEIFIFPTRLFLIPDITEAVTHNVLKYVKWKSIFLNKLSQRKYLLHL